MLGNPDHQHLSMVAAGISPQTLSGKPDSLGFQRSPLHAASALAFRRSGHLCSCSAPRWPCHRPSTLQPDRSSPGAMGPGSPLG